MADEPAPQIAIRIIRDDQLELMTGFLVRMPSGAYWAYPNEDSIGQQPEDAGAIPLEPSLIEEIPRLPNEPRAYLYRGTVDARREVPRPPSAIPSFFIRTRRSEPRLCFG
jgi:hypothetical protein